MSIVQAGIRHTGPRYVFAHFAPPKTGRSIGRPPASSHVHDSWHDVKSIHADSRLTHHESPAPFATEMSPESHPNGTERRDKTWAPIKTLLVVTAHFHKFKRMNDSGR